MFHLRGEFSLLLTFKKGGFRLSQASPLFIMSRILHKKPDISALYDHLCIKNPTIYT